MCCVHSGSIWIDDFFSQVKDQLELKVRKVEAENSSKDTKCRGNRNLASGKWQAVFVSLLDTFSHKNDQESIAGPCEGWVGSFAEHSHAHYRKRGKRV